jgi:hypothetical protein
MRGHGVVGKVLKASVGVPVALVPAQDGAVVRELVEEA